MDKHVKIEAIILLELPNIKNILKIQSKINTLLDLLRNIK